MNNQPRKFTSKFKAKIVLEAIRENLTLTELAEMHELHPTQISNWKREFIERAHHVFESSRRKVRNEPKGIVRNQTFSKI